MPVRISMLMVVGALALSGSASSVAAGPGPLGRQLLASRGVRIYFEHLGKSTGWPSGDVIRQLGSDEDLRRQDNPVAREIRDLYGFHLQVILQASFESVSSSVYDPSGGVLRADPVTAGRKPLLADNLR